ncbi:MAG: YlxR family protein [Acidobacteria bacterium]|nr:YlxR family protein [Acidobacteriota bacterium]
MGARGRTCVACRAVRPKQDLVRLARLADGSVVVDARGRLPGRGAYVCRDAACAARAPRRIPGALRTPADVEAVGRLLSEEP